MPLHHAHTHTGNTRRCVEKDGWIELKREREGERERVDVRVSIHVGVVFSEICRRNGLLPPVKGKEVENLRNTQM